MNDAQVWCAYSWWINHGGWVWDLVAAEFGDYEAFAITYQVCKLVIEAA
jgi:hypothetical protein